MYYEILCFYHAAFDSNVLINVMHMMTKANMSGKDKARYLICDTISIISPFIIKLQDSALP